MNGSIERLAEHSPLGASGAYRWMECAGSVNLSVGHEDQDDDTYSAPGRAAHSLGELCLNSGADAWHLIGEHIQDGIAVDKEMADAVQAYLDYIRRRHPGRNQGNFFVEKRFYCPEIHRLFYGRNDAGFADWEARHLHIHDYKHGAGIVVEVAQNPQLMYYGIGALTHLRCWDNIDQVTLYIHQPRGWHPDGPHRRWTISTKDLAAWRDDVLVPAMHRAEVSRDTKSGEHCRFCLVRRHACPQLMKDFEELEGLLMLANQKGGADKLTNEQVARIFKLEKVYKIQLKAARETAFARLQAGHTGFGLKLVPARANRVWKDGAEKELTKKFGKDAFEPQTLKSPARIDELPEGEAFTKRWAFKPDAGLIVADGDDNRREVSKNTKSMFEAATAKRKGK